MSLTAAEYINILHSQVDIFYHDEGVQHTLINGGNLQMIGHIVKTISWRLRVDYLDLPIVGGYFLYKWDVDYFYLVKTTYGTESKNTSSIKYKIKRPIKDCSPSEYETLLINEYGVLEFAKAEPSKTVGTEQESLF